jgi:hypothetical protein
MEVVISESPINAANRLGQGRMAGGPINSALRFFGEEVAQLAGLW